MGDSPTYAQVLDYLYEKLPMFSRIGKAALKPNLDNTLKLCAALGNPQNKFKSIHIAGTNGKGSVSHALAATFQVSGYKTGLYTSPHLVDFRERIRINGDCIPETWVVDFVSKLKPSIEEIEPSFFEITVAMAFAWFAEEKVDMAIIETGLGGRLDSTNVISPILSVITNISYDHKDLLGDTLAQIASEKAGIIKPGVPAVIGEQHPETERVFFEHSVHKHATLHYAQPLWGMVKVGQDDQYQYFKAVNNARLQMLDIKTDLRGQYQQHNIKTVLTATELLANHGYRVSIENAIAALARVTALTGLRGRWDILRKEPLIVCDVAHNSAGLTEVLEQFSQTCTRRNTPANIILGFVKDKDVRDALRLFPKNATYYFTNAQIPRALPAPELAGLATEAGLSGGTYTSVSEAIDAAIAAAGAQGTVLITGSFFISGEAISYLETATVTEKI